MSSVPDGFGTNNPRERSRAIELDSPLGLIITVDDRVIDVPPADLRGAEQAEAIAQQLRAAAQVTVNVEHADTWQSDDRRVALRFIAPICRQRTDVRVVTGSEPHRDLFSAMVALIERPDDVTRAGRAVEGAVETAALMHDEQLQPACEVILRRLQAQGFRGYRISGLLRSARDLLRNGAASREGDERPLIRSFWQDAPCPEGSVVPHGFNLTADGISFTGEAGTVISGRMVVTQRFLDIDHRTESLEIAWSRDGQHWERRIFPRGELASRQSIVALADYGIPVTSNNAPDLIDYLVDFETANLAELPQQRLSRRLGWIARDGIDGFLCGRRLITDLSIHENDSPVDASENAVGQPVMFQGADAGDEQLVDGFRTAGQFTEWLATIRLIERFPRVQFALYASLCTPLLTILNSPNFVISYAGPTSGGKTTSLRIGASCWGCPEENSGPAAIFAWDATRVWMERTPAVLNNLPFHVDDTKRAPNPKHIAQTVYDITSGRGRGRGSQAGLASATNCRTILISSGEAPLASFTEDGGTRARILELWGSPFNERSEAVAQTIAQIGEGIHDHYGHAGRHFVSFLILNRQNWPAWREQYRVIRDGYGRRAGNNAVSYRMAAHFAVLEIGAVLVHQAFSLGWDYQGTVANLWAEMTRETTEADRAAAALRYVYSWCHSHRADFLGERSVNEGCPTGGWLGRYRVPSRRPEDGECLAIYPHLFDQILMDGGFEPEPTRRNFRDRCWLRTSQNKTTLKVFLQEGGRERRVEMMAIRWSAIHELNAGDEEDDPAPPRRPRNVQVPGRHGQMFPTGNEQGTNGR